MKSLADQGVQETFSHGKI